ncbi:universal stress protein [Kushneria phosphatilytica]|uniref:Universal stress protein n=1 Tax=Kushneria phosphatilytica TaxID=657387 RepID=A0A1S1NPN6_9GAMM|nr:universal stress protein [Kushneria phosphatilytica]OHV10033.1 hypothetical protein BH688_10535 [Kushneria phosphatilytica]QEL11720.1 universal stress protein [Kushneria phosphatilytica]
MFRSLLVPIDGSDYAQTALQIACQLATPNQGTIHLLTVQEPFEPMQYGGDYRVHQMVREAVIDKAEKEGRAILDRAIELMPSSHYKGDVQTLLRLGSPADIIVEEAKRLNVDAIVMGSRGLTDLRGFIVGSVSHKVSHVAECMVISVHEQHGGRA